MSNANLSRQNESMPEQVRDRATVAPFVDVYENEHELLIVADVPGTTPESFDVHFEKGQLTILAKRVEETPGTPLLVEHRPSDFMRVFTVPQGIDAEKIEAELSAGLLRLRLPKSDAIKPRRIEVKRG